MSEYGASPDRDHQPFTLWNGYPIYAATLLVVIHVAMLLVWTLVFAFHRTELVLYFAFSTTAVLHGWIWQPLTYALVHPPGSFMQTLWFAVEMYMLWTFGRELERFFGRRVFLQLYFLLALVTPAVMLLLSWIAPLQTAGSQSLHFAIFVAFATLYPNAQMLFGLTAKWIAVILIAIGVVTSIAANDFLGIILLAASVGTAYLFVRYERGELTLPRLRWPQRKPKFRVLPRPSAPAQRVHVTSASMDPMDDVDALLDKIARTGMASLSAAERARLERASADLKKRPEPL
jgi:membrane associated rhomboid family serine protease